MNAPVAILCKGQPATAEPVYLATIDGWRRPHKVSNVPVFYACSCCDKPVQVVTT